MSKNNSLNLDFFFDDFLDNVCDWDKKSYKFLRDEKDMHPYSIINNKDCTLIIHNIVGIDKKDLTLSLSYEGNNWFILINGKTKDTISGKEYSVSSRFAIDETQLDLTNVVSTMKNGLLYITIGSKKEQQPKNTKIDIKIS